MPVSPTPLSDDSRTSQMKHHAEAWLSAIRQSVTESTYAKYNSVICKHITPHFDKTVPSAITRADIVAFTDYLSIEKSLSAKTVRDILIILEAILKFTLPNDAVVQIYSGIVYPKVEKKGIKTLTDDELHRLFQFLHQDTDYCKLGILLAMMTGLRIGEVCALRWEDISLKNQTVYVHATMQRLPAQAPTDDKKTAVVTTKPKTDHSTRLIPLPKTIGKICKIMMPEDPNTFILTGTQKYMEPRTLQYRLRAYAKKCGINQLHFHMLRHTFATKCVEIDFELKSLSEILGHSSTKITLDLYVHPSLEMKRRNMEKLDSNFLPSSGK